ncbi:hypothetical protein Fleli_1032 [Bernardetia litoralis DSM 6794]|uniref:Uncharacterized protein n=1 Tax=Bernardetia litoralis (strain ATCC 23117 / DSM 6794 / NBRC 15988 / NCIMB 1366 / Fx l1 / Sio-4) TaxID=880071 RepID=I4AHP2_BERLS|nr:hypothetical protein [Bernardetia litoralis]AFM03477.1 hypothetical protein Fleli_1032 [Bernardetia litoralis DSM 6794]
MSVISTLHSVNSKIIEPILNSPELYHYLEKKSTLIEKDGKFYSENKFDTNDSWDVTYKLLNNYFLIDSEKLKSNSYLQHKEVERIWIILEKIELSDIEKMLVNHKIIKKFEESEGYRMYRILVPKSVLDDFIGIKNLFEKAFIQGNSIYIETE